MNGDTEPQATSQMPLKSATTMGHVRSNLHVLKSELMACDTEPSPVNLPAR
jgi:hypothetical protein